MTDIMVLIAPLAAIAACGLLFAALLIIAVQDMFAARRQTVNGRTRLLPVTFIVEATNNPVDVASMCIGIKEAKLKQVDIVIVKRSSATSVAVLKQICMNAKLPVKIYSPRAGKSAIEIARLAYSRSRKGQVVVIASANQCLDPGLVHRLAKGEYIPKNTIYNLPITRDVSGFNGVLLLLQESSTWMYDRLQRLARPSQQLVQGSVYALRAETLFTQSKNAVHDLPARTVMLHKNHIRTGVRRKVMPVVVAAVIIILGTILAAVAISGPGLEAFTITWMTAALLGLSAVVFNPNVSWKSRGITTACTAFMPILLLLTLVIKSSD